MSGPTVGEVSGDGGIDAALIAVYPSLLAYARLLTGDRARAEDVAHEALVRCLRRGRHAPIRQVAAYARRAVLNEVLRDARHHARTPRLDPQRTATPQDRVIEQAALRTRLAQLPARQRTAVVSRFYLDLSEKETAQLLGCSVSAVKSLCHRGIAQLREGVGVEHPQGSNDQAVRAAAGDTPRMATEER